MNKQSHKADSPGVYIPPPLIYALMFLAAMLIQKIFPINELMFQFMMTKIAGIVLLILSLFFSVRSLKQFFQSSNTLILIKPASSLQTNGIYSSSRNPMYVGLSLVYL